MDLKGLAVSPGIAIGKVYIFHPFTPTIINEHIDPHRTQTTLKQYANAKKTAAAELTALIQKMAAEDEDKAKIFKAHRDILEDEALDEEICNLIESDYYNASWAVETVFKKYMDILNKKTDALLRERIADMRDVQNRLLRNIDGIKEQTLAALKYPSIIVTGDLLPSDTATMDRANVLGILTEMGGATSHSAILARNYEIPAVLGVENVTKRVRNGQTIILDALQGRVIADPDKTMLQEYQERHRQYIEEATAAKQYLNREAVTADGIRIMINLNITSDRKEDLAFSKYSDGVGLFRTEFLYMQQEELPSEDQQFMIYRHVLEEFNGRWVTLRTMDIGGDKPLKCMDLPHEDNPFLGNRAVRLCFSQPQVFLTQLKAALRAAYYGNLEIMFPMISSMDDIRKAKAYLEEAKQELDFCRIPYGKNYKVGIMIETPAIAMIADKVVKEVDFASIGTNDLCQYLLAVDRLNPKVSQYYQSFHPSMFRLISFVASEFNKAGKELSVCGEMGGDPKAACVLIGMDIKKLSMNGSSMAAVKRIIHGISIKKMQEILREIYSYSTAEEIEDCLNDRLAMMI